MSISDLADPKRAPGVEAPPPVGASSYDVDYYSWTQEQAALLDAGRTEAVDARNIAEELRDLGSEIYYRLESAYRVLLTQFLKWDHQPERRTRSWVLTITEQRERLDRLLAKNPGLKGRKTEAVSEGYRLARLSAANETELMVKTFPESCPYSLEEIQSRPFVWPLDGEDETF